MKSKIIMALLAISVLATLLSKETVFNSETAKTSEWGERHYRYSGKGQDKLSLLTVLGREVPENYTSGTQGERGN